MRKEAQRRTTHKERRAYDRKKEAEVRGDIRAAGGKNKRNNTSISEAEGVTVSVRGKKAQKQMKRLQQEERAEPTAKGGVKRDRYNTPKNEKRQEAKDPL